MNFRVQVSIKCQGSESMNLNEATPMDSPEPEEPAAPAANRVGPGRASASSHSKSSARLKSRRLGRVGLRAMKVCLPRSFTDHPLFRKVRLIALRKISAKVCFSQIRELSEEESLRDSEIRVA